MKEFFVLDPFLETGNSLYPSYASPVITVDKNTIIGMDGTKEFVFNFNKMVVSWLYKEVVRSLM